MDLNRYKWRKRKGTKKLERERERRLETGEETDRDETVWEESQLYWL